MIREIVFVLIILLLAVFQASFLVRLGALGYLLSPLFLMVFLVNFLENHQKKNGLFLGALAGFLLDLLSGLFLGVFTLIFLGIAFLVKKLSFCLSSASVCSFLFSAISAFLLYVVLCFSFLFLADLIY